MEIRIDTETEELTIGGIRWSTGGLLGFLESLGMLQPGERIEATRSGGTVTFVRVEVPKPGV